MAIELQNVNELVGRMLQKQVYVVFSTLVKPVEAMKQILPEHLQFMIDLEQRGILFASGPYFDEERRLQGDGLTVLRADSLAEARAIADQDPFHIHSIRTYTIKGWQINEGSYTVQITYSDRAYRVE